MEPLKSKEVAKAPTPPSAPAMRTQGMYLEEPGGFTIAALKSGKVRSTTPDSYQIDLGEDWHAKVPPPPTALLPKPLRPLEEMFAGPDE